MPEFSIVERKLGEGYMDPSFTFLPKSTGSSTWMIELNCFDSLLSFLPDVVLLNVPPLPPPAHPSRVVFAEVSVSHGQLGCFSSPLIRPVDLRRSRSCFNLRGFVKSSRTIWFSRPFKEKSMTVIQKSLCQRKEWAALADHNLQWNCGMPLVGFTDVLTPCQKNSTRDRFC